eukprot:7360378-Prymnesium_polylepis.1
MTRYAGAAPFAASPCENLEPMRSCGRETNEAQRAGVPAVARLTCWDVGWMARSPEPVKAT